MFATYDMNPIARNAMEMDRLAAEIAYVDRGARWQFPASMIIAMVAVVVILL